LYNRRPYGLGLDAPVTPSTVGKYAGNPIIVLGGSSAVGQSGVSIFPQGNDRQLTFKFSALVIQLAKISGFSPIITTASVRHTVALKGFGADVVLSRDLSTDELKQEILKHTSKPIKFIYDAISLESTQHTAVDLLASNGTLVTTLADAIGEFDQGKTSVRVQGILRLEENVALLEELFQNHLSGWLEKGLIQVRISKSLCENLTDIILV